MDKGQQRELARLEAEFTYLKGMWNSPLVVAQQQVRLLTRAGYRLVPGEGRLAPFARSSLRVVAIGLVGAVLVFAIGLLIGWDLPGSAP